MADKTHFADDATLAHIAKLERENADLAAQIKAHEAVRDACFEALPECQVWGDVPWHIADLTAKLAAAQRDAERYRWLRDGFTSNCVDVHELTLDADEMTSQQFDTAIDAEILLEKVSS